MQIRDDLNPDQYERLTVGNLRRQFDLLRDLVEVVRDIPAFRVNGHMVKWLHLLATIGLVEAPDQYRDHDVQIKKSSHVPPPHKEVTDLMGRFIGELHRRWPESDEFTLAAFALWRLCWIHPFEDGNGRTARAVALLIICQKVGGWLPGRQSVLEKMKMNGEEYRLALQHADETSKTAEADIRPLALLLSKHTLDQVSGI
jgi:Fic family protein